MRGVSTVDVKISALQIWLRLFTQILRLINYCAQTNCEYTLSLQVSALLGLDNFSRLKGMSKLEGLFVAMTQQWSIRAFGTEIDMKFSLCSRGHLNIVTVLFSLVPHCHGLYLSSAGVVV
jgi:hypothetical protein